MLKFLFLGFLFFQHPIQAKESAENIVFSEGDTWSRPAIGKVWIEDGEILKVSPEGNRFVFKALKPGQTEVHIGNQNFWVSILSRRQNRTWELLQQTAPQTLGLKVVTHEGLVMVEGPLTRLEDWEILAQACAQKNCNYRMSAKISPALEHEIQSEFEKKLQKIQAYPYRLEFSEHLTLHLPPKFPQALKINELMARYGVEIITVTSSLELLPLVKLQITVAEIKRKESLTYGIKWPESYQAQILPSYSEDDPLSIALQALEDHGLGRVLASPNILCRSGKEAEFLAGGEFPIKIINFKLQDVVWKKYGILLRVKPLADYSGRMSISLETEVSSIDNSMKVDGVPALSINRLQSYFDLTSPQTIALSGLLKHETSENSSGLPGLSRIPILGSLFSSKDYQDNKTELVIFVRPEIVQPKDKI